MKKYLIISSSILALAIITLGYIPQVDTASLLSYSTTDSTSSDNSRQCGYCTGWGSCPNCYGKGYNLNYDGTERTTCLSCGGSGKCPSCGGTGRK